MSFCLILGFLTGFIIPFIAGRFGKIIPADPGLLLLRLFHRPHFPRPNDPMRKYLLKKKWKKLLFISALWGITMGGMFGICFYFLPHSYFIWGCIFCWIMATSMVIDAEYCLLPDFFTIPLLLLGLFFSYVFVEIGIEAGLIGAVGGYLICVFSVFFMGLFLKNPEFGGGDVKMLTALGAWLGILGLNYALILSFFLFAVLNALPIQRKGAYGPALGVAAITVFLMLYAK